MKRLIRWLARVFNAEIVRVEVKEIVKEVQVIHSEYIADVAELNGDLDGDLVVRGNMTVNGTVIVTGELLADGCITAKEYGRIAGKNEVLIPNKEGGEPCL